MKKLWTTHWKELLIVGAYIVVASLVYGRLFHSLWKLWYVDVIIVLVIVAIGAIIGYFYIKGMDKEKEAQEKELDVKVEDVSIEEKGGE